MRDEDFDGSEVQRAFVKTAEYTTGLAVDGGHIYWAMPNDNYIGRAAINGRRSGRQSEAGRSEEEVADRASETAEVECAA